MKKVSAACSAARWFPLGLALTSPFIASSPARADDLSWKVYGFLKPEIVTATRGASTFGRENLGAVTGAYPGQTPLEHEVRSHFSVAQSRIGTTFKPRANLTGQLEVDFIDFSKASPTVAAVPRLRLARLEYALSENTSLLVGQDWDLFSPTKPFTYNYVGLYFQAGNPGFIRQQVALRHRLGAWEIAAAIAGNGVNTGANDNAVELTRVPVTEARISRYLGERSRVGVSALYNRRGYTNAANALEHRSLEGYNAFGEFHFGRAVDLNLEGYYGKNLADSGSALTISQGAYGVSTREVGGYASFQVRPHERWTVFGGAGQARVIDAGKLTAFTVAASNSGATFSIARNRTAKLGFTYAPNDRLKIYTEGARYLTRYAGTGAYPQANVNVVETGMLLPF